MKEIVVISGKGGTGKTSIAASLAYLGGKDIVLADCDVDASNMHLLMQPDFKVSQDFYSGELAVINQETCIQCGKCADVCRFDAVKVEDNMHLIEDISCEGCGYCARVCPVDAITNIIPKVGEYYTSTIKTGGTMIHARLDAGADNSGKLVTQVKTLSREIAQRENCDIIIIDGAPGIGCPVIASLSGAHFVLLVTEPSVSGLHDLKRVYELVKGFHIKAGCIINKCDINPTISAELKEFLSAEDIPLISSIPYDSNFTQSMTMGRVIIEDNHHHLKKLLNQSWADIKTLTENN